MNCPVCSCERVKYDGINKQRRVTHWWTCRDCSHSFVFPIPDDIIDYYKNDDYRMDTHRTRDPLFNLGEEQSRARRLLPVIEKYNPIRSHLDIGSSTGLLLRTVGAEIRCGVEPSRSRRETYNFDNAETIDVVKDRYDLVTIIHTLEHVAQPIVLLEHARRRCTRVMIVEVPVSGRTFPHLHEFRRGTIEEMMKKIGFDVHREGRVIVGVLDGD